MALKNRQIFIVDDDASVRQSLNILLATYGFTVKTFSSADEYFRVVTNSVPGCLILDIHMPECDGWEALLNLQISGSRRPVIIISADKAGGLKEKALKSGAVGYLQKPFDGQSLVDLIESSINTDKT